MGGTLEHGFGRLEMDPSIRHGASVLALTPVQVIEARVENPLGSGFTLGFGIFGTAKLESRRRQPPYIFAVRTFMGFPS